MMYVGIDIGKTGAMAFLNSEGQFLAVEDLPIETYQNGKGNKERWRLDTLLFMRLIYRLNVRDCLMIEDVWANATNGSMSAMGMGTLLGGIHAVLSIHSLSPHYVSPRVWKRHFHLIKEDKGCSLSLARDLFPGAPLTRKKDHNRAEALLIARYAYEVQR